MFSCVDIFFHFSQISRSQMARSSCRYSFNFLRNRLFLNMVLSFYISTLALCKSSNSFINSPALLNFSHSNRCLVAVHHGHFYLFILFILFFMVVFKRPWCWERLRAGEGSERGWDHWMASSTQWTWVWANSRTWWRTGKGWHAAVHGVTKSRTWLSDWRTTVIHYRGFPGGTVVKCSLTNVGDTDSVPGSGRSPAGGNGNPLQYSCLKKIPWIKWAWQDIIHGATKTWI